MKDLLKKHAAKIVGIILGILVSLGIYTDTIDDILDPIAQVILDTEPADEVSE